MDGRTCVFFAIVDQIYYPCWTSFGRAISEESGSFPFRSRSREFVREINGMNEGRKGSTSYDFKAKEEGKGEGDAK